MSIRLSAADRRWHEAVAVVRSVFFTAAYAERVERVGKEGAGWQGPTPRGSGRGWRFRKNLTLLLTFDWTTGGSRALLCVKGAGRQAWLSLKNPAGFGRWRGRVSDGDGCRPDGGSHVEVEDSESGRGAGDESGSCAARCCDGAAQPRPTASPCGIEAGAAG